MEKILLALDPLNTNMSTIDFACYIARLTKSRLTGVFLEDLLDGERPVMRQIQGATYLNSDPVQSPVLNGECRNGTEGNIRNFEEACDCRSVSTLVHRDRGVPATEIIEESRYADLIIVDAETSFTRSNEALPGRFVKDVLLESECPVIISPYDFDHIEEVIFSYNGSKSSVFAIKQFTYLFPELRQKKAIVVSVKNDGSETLAEQYKMKEWLKNHYSDVEYVILKGEPADQLFGYLIEKKNGIVVMGAYGRNMLSRFFKPSHARLIVKTINLPIFIAHY
jgi:nucleotide-binding universal stress UspA family protein